MKNNSHSMKPVCIEQESNHLGIGYDTSMCRGTTCAILVA